ncbi:MAG: deoxyguanosinetriphosphate triphosphohydrolase [Halanaerobiales bacterium]|nr:deoxyguanosinetriphosphate triphosphohydrolase [Halanaerobiales bacterium]
MRKFTEEKELRELSKYANFSIDSNGRRYQEKKCEFRTCYQRDRDRIIHSKAFRRLKHKTQVFIAPEGDHYRTRLTHTLEVSQIARTIARSLRLNEDLTEAISLGHDLGHTPFGHAGEEALSEVCSTKFEHNKQSLRVVNYLEKRKEEIPGLNLTDEVRDGILNHTGDNEPKTLEGKIVRISDRIAYINHDIDDAIRADLISIDDLPQDAINTLGKNHSKRIDTMVRDMINMSMGKSDISRSKEVYNATRKLRKYLFENIYFGSLAKKEESKAIKLLQLLFKYYMNNTEQIPDQFRLKESDFTTEQIIIDYIAGMSDRYAIKVGKDLFIPKPWYVD